MKLINLTLDWETYYDSEYTLKKMPTACYVHDERFLIYGLGYKFEDQKSVWLDSYSAIHDFLDSTDWSKIRLIGHNLNFDGYILKVHFNYQPAMFADTQFMAHAVMPYLASHSLYTVSKFLNVGKKDRAPLHNVKGKRVITKEESEELGEYCRGDCDKSWKIYDRLQPYISDQEFKLMDMTNRMMVNPQFMVDIPKLREFHRELIEERKSLIQDSGVSLTTLRSTPKMVKELAKHGIDPPTKPSPKNPENMIPTFEKIHPDVTELLVHEKPEVRRLIKARLNVMSSLRINRAERFIAVAEATDGKFPVPLKYCAAHTGRWGGTDKLNAQNIPRGPLRESLIAPPHHVVLAPDLSQIEARKTAWMADHYDLLDKFANPDIDPYCDFAAAYFQKPVEEIMALGKKSKERFIGKTCVLGLGFGMGWKKLRSQFLTTYAYTGIELTKEEAYRAVELYRTINYPIKLFWNFLSDTVIPRMASAAPGIEYGFKCIQYGKDYIRLPSGRCLLYPNLRAEEGQWPDGEPKIEWVYDYKNGKEKIYGGKLTENLAQALARDLCGEFMLEIGKKYPIATMTHDEIVCVVHKAQAEEALEAMLEIMSTPPSWAPDLPLAAEGEYNERYS